MSDLYLYLHERGLVTLKGQNIPEVVDGDFNCRKNYLTSLEFGPKEVGGDYWCNDNQLTSLEFCANKIGEDLYIDQNLITNLKDIHKQFKNGYISGLIGLEVNPIQSHVLGVILIPKLTGFYINNKELQKILNTHLKTKDVLECQEELIQNNFREFAQL